MSVLAVGFLAAVLLGFV